MWVSIGLLIFAGWRIYLHFSAITQKPVNTPTQAAPTQTPRPLEQIVVPTSTLTVYYYLYPNSNPNSIHHAYTHTNRHPGLRKGWYGAGLCSCGRIQDGQL